MVNDEEPKASTSTMETANPKNKQKNQGKKRKRQSSESSNDNEIILPDNALETERNVHVSAMKNNLDETSVRKIIKKVVTNDHVLAFVKLREEEDDSSTDDKKLQPKLTRAKVKELKKDSTCKSSAWDLENLELTPIKHIPVKTRPEVKALIAQELPDDEDDDEYEPNHDEVLSDDDHVESCSDLDSQPRTPATPATPSPRVVKDGPFKVPQDITKARRKLEIEEEEATIALRTRSKLSLSSTSIEHIESTFVPPDDIPIQDVDDLWNEFLNECLNPASVAKNEEDDETLDETDPEYNVAADPDAHDEDEETLSKSIIKISKKELNDLVTELFSILPENAEEELVRDLNTSVLTTNTQTNTQTNPSVHTTKWYGKQEPMSDEENSEKPSHKLEFEDDDVIKETEQNNNNNGKEKSGKGKQIEKENEQKQKDVPTKVDTPNLPCPRLTINTKNKCIEISIEEREEVSETNPKVEAPPSLWNTIKYASETVRIQVDSTVTLSQNQQLILQQQLRQHIQLATSNFMQTVVHPVHWKMAPQFKEYLTSLMGVAEKNEKSVVNVCNLKPAYELMTTWEASVTEDNEENRKMIEFIASQVEKCRRRISQNSLYSGDFHETFKKVIANSPVFLYPYLLPSLPYRPDSPRRFCYLHSEDMLIALGLAQFWPYVESNPEIFKLHKAPIPSARRGFMATVELVCKHMFPWITTNRLAGHIMAIRDRADKHNPIYRYFKLNEVPVVEHSLLPYNPSLTLYEQPEYEMPRVWVRYLAKTSQRFKKFYYKRPVHIMGRQPHSVPMDTENTQETIKKPLPIDFERSVSARSSLHVQQPKEQPTNRLDVDITKVGPETTSVVIPQNFYRLISTTSGHYLLPLRVTNNNITNTVNSTGPITTPAVTPSNITKNITDPAVVSSPVTKNIAANTKIIFDHMEHCMCCVLLRKICKKRQSLITEFFKKEKEERICQCNSKHFPKISNRLKLLVRNCKKKSELVFKELERRLIENESFNAEKDLNSKDLALVFAYQLKVFTKASMSKRIYVKQRVSNLLTNFDLANGDAEKLANELFKVFGTELVDCYMDFLCFLTPVQAESMGAFKDYFTRNCAEDLMEKIEEQVSDKTTRDIILTQLNSTLLQHKAPCEMCEALLGTMGEHPTLAQYTFNLFPHTREHRPRVCQTIKEAQPPSQPTTTTTSTTTTTEKQKEANNKICYTQQTMVDYEADDSSSDEDPDALSVDLEASAKAQDEAEIYVKPEPVIEENNPLDETKIKTDDYSDSEIATSVMSEEDIKFEDNTDWTKSEDRIVLQVLQEHLTKEERKDRTIIDLLEEKNVYGMLYDCLDRSLCQIKERVLYLLTMLVVSERDT